MASKMAKRSNHTSSLAATVLVIFNFLIMLFCLLAFAISLWAIASPGSLVYVTQVMGNPALKALITEDSMTVQLGLSGAMLSAFFFCICMMGFYGAITGSQFLLFMYASLVVLLLLLECALMYYFSSTIIEKGIQDDGQWTHALRLSLECCDKNYTTIVEPVKPTWSCCGAGVFPKNCTVEKIFKKDCQQAVISWLQKYQILIYSSLVVFHLMLALSSLIRRSLSGSYSPSIASS